VTIPLGVTLRDGGVDVAVYSEHASCVYFCLFDGEREVQRVALARQGHVHTAFVSGVVEGQRYGLRAEGIFDPKRGMCFDVSKLLIDPYARAIDDHADWHEDLAVFGLETAHLVPKSVVTKPAIPAKRLPKRTPFFIYEVPVRAFTKLHPDVPEAQRGTIAALASDAVLAHLKRIGVDTIELMPIAAWTDERHLARQGLRNAWGYNPTSFFAVEPNLAPGGLQEVRNTLATLHAHGFQVVLDVVFNHTGESDLGGGTFSLRGLDQSSYYRMHDGNLVNDAGTGNTMRLDHPAAMQLVLEAMRHWVDLGFDGFRYDLAPVMGRTSNGFTVDAPLMRAIQSDPVLCGVIHIAEPWDVGPGGYQLGNFPAGWHEWNDTFRDEVRKFWRGDGAVSALATRLAGSSDIFQKPGRSPAASINFVAAHDGFSLRDCVTHGGKRNQANGEDNRDGSSHEVCWVARDPAAMIRSLLATLFLSRGTPMLTAGDEFGRTQGGNNNAYAQDNETTWLDWARADDALIDFVAALVRLRAELFAQSDGFLSASDVTWMGSDGQVLVGEEWSNAGPGLMMLVNTPKRMLVAFNSAGSIDSLVLPAGRWNKVPVPGGGQSWGVWTEQP
jgi:glycogen debranching enzyme